MEEGMNHDSKVETEENRSEEEEMEEEVENEIKEPEPDDTAMEEMEGEGEEDTSLLEPGPGEEEAGEVDVQEEEKLLREEEVIQDNQEEMSGEDILRNFIGPDFRNITDDDDQYLSELYVNSPKDSMSDGDDSTPKVECQAKANESESCEISQESNYNSAKPTHGSTLNYQDESPEHLLSSTTAALQEEEIVLVEGGEGEEGGGEDEVVCLKEVKGGEEEQERKKSTREEGSSEAREGHRMASADICCKDVKVETM